MNSVHSELTDSVSGVRTTLLTANRAALGPVCRGIIAIPVRHPAGLSIVLGADNQERQQAGGLLFSPLAFSLILRCEPGTS
ncbi:MAG: hypothetical protein V7634_2674 [Bradyrhizobium sp.]|jgi:hypothetical protein